MFDPYLIWLDIPTHERPATYYRLLGLRPLESDPQTITAAASRVIAHVSRFQQTEQATACQALLAELTAARNCLLDPMRKSAYDSGIARGNAPGEHPLHSTPQIPGGSAGERQIAHSPPVPGMPVPGMPIPATPSPETSVTPPSVPQPSIPHQPLPTGLPYSVQPVVAPSVPSQPSASAAGYQSPDAPTSNASPMSSQPSTAPQQPPAWAAAQRTGEVETVIAGQGPSPADAEQPNSGRGNRSRKLRRAQQANSAYMLVGIAMAMIVFFFGAVLVLAIYLGG